MRKLFVLLAAIFAFSTILFGQQTSPAEEAPKDLPKTEVFAGFSYMHTNLNNFGLGTGSVHGETAQVTRYVLGNIGLTGDVSRNTGINVAQSGENVYRWTYLFGPTYALRTDSSFVPFVHVLFGADHERLSIPYLNAGMNGDTYSTAFAASLGGGIDVRVSDHLAARLAQIDYIHTSHSGGESAFRYGVGLVVKF
jgi:hypothetical protein